MVKEDFWLERGKYIEKVKSKNKKQYPADGIEGRFWYVLIK